MIQHTIKGMLCFLMLVSAMISYGQSSFTIIGTGEKIRDGDSLFLSYKENGSHILKKTAAYKNRFTFTGSIKEPVKAHIYRNENPEIVNIITESVDVYLENGLITISSPDTLTGAVISGTVLNDTLQLLQNQLAVLKKKRSGIKDPDLFTEEEKADTALVNHHKRELKNIYYQIVDVELAFAEKHPNSYVSLDILLNGSRINTYINKVAQIYAHLAENLQQSSAGNMISERIRKKQQVTAGMKAIDFSIKNTSGQPVNLSSLRGKYVLLDFWASWCGPCREEHPNLIKMYQNYKNKNFTILSVSIDTDKAEWINAISQDKLSWSQVSDLKGDKGEVYLKYGITSIPANFVIDPNGIVIAKDLKGDALVSYLSSLFNN
jgi:peroxiredoxin